MSLHSYPDWQRVENWDSPVLWSENVTGQLANIVGPIIDVSTYAALGGFLSCPQGAIRLTLEWYLDPAGTVLVGARVLMLDTTISNSMQMRVLNLGPYCQVKVAAAGAGQYGLRAELFGTNRVLPAEIAPVEPILLAEQLQTLAAGAAVNIAPTDYWSGPVFIWVNASAELTVTLQSLNDSGVWIDVAQWVFQTSQTVVPVVIPPGAWRIGLANTGTTATTYWLVVVPSFTGAT